MNNVKELTRTTESLPEVMENVTRLTADKAYTEIIKLNEVPFTPVADDHDLALIKDYALQKLNELASLKIPTTQQETIIVESDQDSVPQEATLDTPMSVEERLSIEKDLAKLQKLYSDMVIQCNKERRMMGGQTYGASQGHHMTKTVTQQTIKFGQGAAEVITPNAINHNTVLDVTPASD